MLGSLARNTAQLPALDVLDTGAGAARAVRALGAGQHSRRHRRRLSGRPGRCRGGAPGGRWANAGRCAACFRAGRGGGSFSGALAMPFEMHDNLVLLGPARDGHCGLGSRQAAQLPASPTESSSMSQKAPDRPAADPAARQRAAAGRRAGRVRPGPAGRLDGKPARAAAGVPAGARRADAAGAARRHRHRAPGPGDPGDASTSARARALAPPPAGSVSLAVAKPAPRADALLRDRRFLGPDRGAGARRPRRHRRRRHAAGAAIRTDRTGALVGPPAGPTHARARRPQAGGAEAPQGDRCIRGEQRGG